MPQLPDPKVLATPIDNWVTVSPKKRARSSQSLPPRKPSLLNPHSAPPPPTSAHGPPLHPVSAQPDQNELQKDISHFDSGITATNTIPVMIPKGVSSPLHNLDNVGADMMDEGVETDENVDLFLNLENIEDVEMSTDSAKRKRIEEGEECSSHA